MWWRLRFALNVVNLSTPLGLVTAAAGRARLARGPRGLILATGYRLGFPHASAFTIGNVILSQHDLPDLIGRADLLRHEERHATQYACCLGVLMLPMYAGAALWSYARGGDHATYNVFETRAGLADGGYPLLSRQARS
ncbi:MAG: hypothetical protein QM655_09525 [Nocardioidaceae bacterium]